jgi:glycosyltransferase involved in cell wall biosynthesis
LEKAQSLIDHWPDARFIWVGDGGLRAEWEQRIKTAGLENRILCAGWQNDIASFLAAGDMMLHVAEYEGLPLALIEGMAMGLPCIVLNDLLTEIGVLTEEDVFLADDIADLAVKARSIAARSMVAESAKKLFEQRLTVQAMTASYVRLYDRAIADSSVQTNFGTVG